VESKDAILTKFGRNAQELRKRKNLSQEKLAERAGLDSTYISGIERGVRNPSVVAVVRLAAGLEAQPGELFAGISQ
jgi:transcriptional regulator with XRE-family HTH domain